MLHQLRTISDAQCSNIPPPSLNAIDDRWKRDMKEDMKSAIDLLWKFKEGLDKLHPECLNIIERMMHNPNYRF